MKKAALIGLLILIFSVCASPQEQAARAEEAAGHWDVGRIPA